MRFDGALNIDLAEFQTNLVPYPSISGCLTSLSPMSNFEAPDVPEMGQISNALFQADHFLQNCNPVQGKYMAVSVLYRGDIIPKYVSAAIGTIKTKRYIQFVDWAPTGFKCGINYQPR